MRGKIHVSEQEVTPQQEWVGGDRINFKERAAYEALKADPINSPSHYLQGGIESIDAIEAALTPEEFRGFCKGNALKYVWRERHKGGGQDLGKAAWYLARAERKQG